MRVSNSSKDKYNSCARKYYYHYIAKLRSPKLGSALFFGNALDDSFSRLLLDKKMELTDEESLLLKKAPEVIFSEKMVEAKNDAGQVIQLAKSPLADYYTSDFDSSLFTSKTISSVKEMEPTLDTITKIVKFHEECKANLNWRNKDKRRLTDDEFQLYNYLNWLSLNEKGKLMLQAYKRDIIPKIAQVYAIQKEIEIKNEEGDVINGKIDYIASFTDDPSVPYIMDNKTSSKAYSADSVQQSEQLATYGEAEQNFNCGYSVVQKEVFKKEPKIRTQLIKGVVAEETIEKTLDIYANLCHNLSVAGDNINNFPKNESSCFSFGKICPYYQICKYNNYDNLIDCSKKENKDE